MSPMPAVELAVNQRREGMAIPLRASTNLKSQGRQAGCHGRGTPFHAGSMKSHANRARRPRLRVPGDTLTSASPLRWVLSGRVDSSCRCPTDEASVTSEPGGDLVAPRGSRLRTFSEGFRAGATLPQAGHRLAGPRDRGVDRLSVHRFFVIECAVNAARRVTKGGIPRESLALARSRRQVGIVAYALVPSRRDISSRLGERNVTY